MNEKMLVIAICCFVFMIIQNVYFLVCAVSKSKKEGIVNRKIKNNILSSAVFSILPAFSVSLTLVPLSQSLGREVVFIRSIFTGSVQDNILAAETILNAFNLDLNNGNITPIVFVTVLWGMSLSGISGLILIGFLSSKSKKTKCPTKKHVISNEKNDIKIVKESIVTKDVPIGFKKNNTTDNIAKKNIGVEVLASFKKKNFKVSKILSMSFDLFGKLLYIGIIGVYFAKQIASEGTPEVVGDGAGFLSLITVLLSGGLVAFFSKLGEKTLWLKNLSVPLSMLLAFAIIVLLSLILPESMVNFEWRN